ncbi:MAG TPA: hypothetical protein VGC32_20395 [Solirubrobacterales bacterium]
MSMPEEPPIVCSLGAVDLTARLRLIVAIGAAHLVSRETEGVTELLRFRRGEDVRRSLEGVIAAQLAAAFASA